MRHVFTSIAVGALLVTALLGQSQTIELRSGEVVIGRVSDVTDREVTIAVNFPDPTTRAIPRADLAPLSLYTIMAARTEIADAKAHVKLAQLARDLGLPAQAIAEYREAARLDPALKAESDAKILEVRRTLAADLLADAREAFEENRLSAARLLAMSILGMYKDTPSANDASQLLEKIRTEENAGRKVRELPANEVESALRKMGAHLKNAEQTGVSSPHGGSKEQRRLESVVSHLEQAWSTVKDIAPAQNDKELADRLRTAREATRRQLVDAYLTLGAIYLGRRAIPNAERNCEKACELDPENKENHALHDLILQAKISRGYSKARLK